METSREDEWAIAGGERIQRPSYEEAQAAHERANRYAQSYLMRATSWLLVEYGWTGRESWVDYLHERLEDGVERGRMLDKANARIAELEAELERERKPKDPRKGCDDAE